MKNMKKLILSAAIVGAMVVSTSVQAGYDCVNKSKHGAVTMENILAGHNSNVIMADAAARGGPGFVSQIAFLIEYGVDKLNTDPRYRGVNKQVAIKLFENDVLALCNAN